MKLNRAQIVSGIWLLIRLCIPASVFIIVCTGIFIAFDPLLLWLDQVAPNLIAFAWLGLVIVFIGGGIAFIFLVAKLIRHFFGSEETHVQRRMVFLSGIPFYAVGLLIFIMGVYSSFDPNEPGAAAFFAAASFVLFCLISVIYPALLLVLLKLPWPSLFNKRVKLG